MELSFFYFGHLIIQLTLVALIYGPQRLSSVSVMRGGI